MSLLKQFANVSAGKTTYVATNPSKSPKIPTPRVVTAAVRPVALDNQQHHTLSTKTIAIYVAIGIASIYAIWKIKKVLKGMFSRTDDSAPIQQPPQPAPMDPGDVHSINISTQAEWDTFRDKMRNGSSASTVGVLFYAKWCGHSQRMLPAWEAAVGNLGDEQKGQCLRVDEDQLSKLVEEYKIPGFPALMILGADGNVLQTYAGNRSTDDVHKFLKEYVVVGDIDDGDGDDLAEEEVDEEDESGIVDDDLNEDTAESV